MSHLRVELVQTRNGLWHIEVFVDRDGPFGDGKTYSTKNDAQAACDAFIASLKQSINAADAA